MPKTMGRITRSYADLSGCIRNLSLICNTLIVYQHDMDVKVNRTHIHYAATHECDRKTLKNHIQHGMRYGDKLDGNGDWSTKEWDGDTTSIVYMTKGEHDPVYSHGYTNEEIDAFKKAWKEKPPTEKKKKNELLGIYRSILDSGYKPFFSRLGEVANIKYNPSTDTSAYPRFNEIKSYFFKIMRSEYRHIYPLMTPQFFKDRKTFVLTYCYENEVQMPTAKDFWDVE